jgi:hypothetical protein
MMRIATFFVAVLIATLTLTTTQALAEEEIYRWVDKDGVVHFGNRPGGQEDAEVVELEATPADELRSDSQSPSPYQHNSEPTYAQELREERAESRKETAEKKEEMDALCEMYRERVAKLEPFTRVMVEQEDGSVIRMDDNDRLEKLDESKAFVAENCNK